MNITLLAVLVTVAPQDMLPKKNNEIVATGGSWQIAAGDATCSLSRSFTADGTSIVIVFNKIFDSRDIDLIMLSPTNSETSSRTGKSILTVAPSGDSFSFDYGTSPYPGGHQLSRITIDHMLWDRLSSATELDIEAASLVVRLQGLQFEKAQRALKDCEDKLKVDWDIDPSPIPLQNRARIAGNPAVFFGPSAYPRDALRANVSGTVTTVLTIGVDGRVKDCRIANTANALLNTGTCAAAQKVTFSPAVNAAGQPVRSLYVLPVRWVPSQR